MRSMRGGMPSSHRATRSDPIRTSRRIRTDRIAPFLNALNTMSTAGAHVLSRRYRPLVFSVKRKVWRQDDADMEPAHAEYKAKRPVVLAKGDYRCVFCGFRSKHTEVHHCNDDHADNRDENLAIADPLCHGTQHIGQVGSQQHGVLIYFEDFAHAEFNHLQRTLAVALEIGNEAEKREAHALLQHLASRAEQIASAWGSAHPSDFANALLGLNETAFEQRGSSLVHIRLLYKPARLSSVMGRWVDESYASLPVDTWERIYERACGVSQ